MISQRVLRSTPRNYCNIEAFHTENIALTTKANHERMAEQRRFAELLAGCVCKRRGSKALGTPGSHTSKPDGRLEFELSHRGCQCREISDSDLTIGVFHISTRDEGSHIVPSKGKNLIGFHSIISALRGPYRPFEIANNFDPHSLIMITKDDTHHRTQDQVEC